MTKTPDHFPDHFVVEGDVMYELNWARRESEKLYLLYGGYGVAVAQKLVELLVWVQLPVFTPEENELLYARVACDIWDLWGERNQFFLCSFLCSNV